MSDVYRTAEESGASVEELIILCCIRLQAGTHEADQFEKLLQSGVDWDALVRLAREEVLSPVLYHQLSTRCPTLVPPAVLEQLHSDYQSNAEHNKMLIQDLLTIVERFNREGIPIIPYKDPLLAHSAYGNETPRVYTDLDVFIHKTDVPRATDVLSALGYVHIARVGSHSIFAKDPASYYRTFTPDLVWPFDFANDRTRKLELHWGFVPGRWSVTRNNDALWARTRKVPVDGTDVLSFSLEDNLLLACIHGAAIHGWLFWELVEDVATLITSHIDLNWDQLVTIARQRGCLRILTVGLLLANEVAGVPLPEDIKPRLDHDPRTRAYVESVIAQIFFHRDDTWRWGIMAMNLPPTDFRYVVFMQERVRDKCLSLLRVVILPVPSDIEMLPSLASRKRIFYLLHPALTVVRVLKYRLKLRA
jgi:hypothetical protein